MHLICYKKELNLFFDKMLNVMLSLLTRESVGKSEFKLCI